MSIDLQASAVARAQAAKAAQAPPANVVEKVPAKYWLNIGYDIDVQAEDGTMTTKFVPIPVGAALDTQKPLDVSSKNEGFSAFQQARNDLLTQLIELGATFKPGQEETINLIVKLRRVEDKRPVIQPEGNPFSRVLKLVG
jgi:hypothetical protein